MKLDDVKAREEALRIRVRALEGEARKSFYREFNRRLKDPDTYAVLNYLFITGLHHFYLGKWLRGAVNILVLFAGIMLMLVGLIWTGVLVIVVITLLEFRELFQSEAIVTDYNNQLMEELLRNGRAIDDPVVRSDDG